VVEVGGGVGVGAAAAASVAIVIVFEYLLFQGWLVVRSDIIVCHLLFLYMSSSPSSISPSTAAVVVASPCSATLLHLLMVLPSTNAFCLKYFLSSMIHLP